MAQVTEKEIAADLARELVAALSPQELPLFRAQSEAYFQDPQKALERRSGKDEVLGFGVGEAATFLTPIALTVAVKVVDFLIDVVREYAKEQGTRAVNEGVKRLLRKPPKKSRPEDERAALPFLTQEQVMQIRQVAFEKARQLLPEAQAGLLADSMVGHLTTRSP